MRLIQEADLDLQFDQAERPSLVKSLAGRMSLSSPRLAAHASELQGETYKALFESAIDIVGLGRQTPDARWLGWNDNWTVEFFPALARAFPDARFIVIIRDVRSSIASLLRISDLTRIALPMSFVRCWRKQIALARYYQHLKLFQGRLCVMTYEQLVRYPEQMARHLCEFLEVEYLPEMVDGANFVGPDGGPWIPNSNFDDAPRNIIYQGSIERWKQALPAEVVRLIEFVAGRDLEMAGYDLSEPGEAATLRWDAYRRHVQDHLQCRGWRTDSRNPDIDLGLDMLRWNCLAQWTEDSRLVERCFLFAEAYESLYQRVPLFARSDEPVY
jgi:hypothetical protein